MNPEIDCKRRGHHSMGLVLGIGVVLLGVVLLLDEIPGLGDSALLGFIKNLWPLILVAMGIVRLRTPEAGHPAKGWGFLAAGGILLLVTLGHGHFDALIGPALVVAVGIFIILRTLRRQRGTPPEPDGSDDYLRGTAILSGFKRQVRSQALKGGELTAIFGGFELDLRQATLVEDTAKVDVFILFGGGEIRVPEDWEVVIQASAIAGGIDDKKLVQGPPENRRRLILTGSILFGGIEVKN